MSTGSSHLQTRLLVCRTVPVLAFYWDERTGRAQGSGRVLDCERLPLAFTSHGKPAVYAKQIDAWWRSRAVPPSRDGIRRVLDDLGLASTAQLLAQTHAFSLSDQYWVTTADDGAIRTPASSSSAENRSAELNEIAIDYDAVAQIWHTRNFFDNPFPAALGELLLTQVSSSARVDFDAPDASTGGDLPKRWTINGGERLLIKAGRSGQEPLNELIATHLCERLGIAAVPYSLAVADNRLVSICPDMLTDREELIPVFDVLETVKRNNRLGLRDQWHESCRIFLTRHCQLQPDAAAPVLAQIAAAADGMLLVDWLLRNTDRHWRNFGLIRDVETLEVRPAPLFDNGQSLWTGEFTVDNREYAAKPFFQASEHGSARRHLGLIQDWSRFDLTCLHDWPDDVAHRLSTSGLLADQRIANIRNALNWRVRVAQETQAATLSR